jgi:hypothetical protein
MYAWSGNASKRARASTDSSDGSRFFLALCAKSRGGLLWRASKFIEAIGGNEEFVELGGTSLVNPKALRSRSRIDNPFECDDEQSEVKKSHSNTAEKVLIAEPVSGLDRPEDCQSKVTGGIAEGCNGKRAIRLWH